MNKIVIIAFIAFFTHAWAENFMVIDKKGVQTKVRIADIDSIFFVQSNTPLYGTILYTRPFYAYVEEFNTNRINTTVTVRDNDFGAWNPAGGPTGTGSADHSSSYLSTADLATDAGLLGSVKLTNLYSDKGECLGINEGDTLFVSATIQDNIGNDETQIAFFAVISNPIRSSRDDALHYQVATLQQFLLCTQDFLTGTSWNGGGGSNANDLRIGILPEAEIIIENGPASAASVKNIMISSSNLNSTAKVSGYLAFPPAIPANDWSKTPRWFLRPAKGTDPFFDYWFYDATWNPGLGNLPMARIYLDSGKYMDLSNDDTARIIANVGAYTKSSSSFKFKINEAGVIHSATTLQDFADAIRAVLQLPPYDNTAENNSSVSINPAGSADLIPDGSIVIRGQPDSSQAIIGFTCTSRNRPNFNANMTVREY